MRRGEIGQGVIGGHRIVRHVHDAEQAAEQVPIRRARKPLHCGRDGLVTTPAMCEPTMPVMSRGVAVNAHADAHLQPFEQVEETFV